MKEQLRYSSSTQGEKNKKDKSTGRMNIYKENQPQLDNCEE